MFNIAYRVFLYSYAYYAICQNKDESEEHEKMTWASFKKILKKIFVNPVIIATFLGFILWSLQLVGDASDTNNFFGLYGKRKKSVKEAFATMSGFAKAPFLNRTPNWT